jgi:hypothetical protein
LYNINSVLGLFIEEGVGRISIPGVTLDNLLRILEPSGCCGNVQLIR